MSTSSRVSAAQHIEAYFCPEGVDPFETCEWDLRTAAIKDENGKVLFEQTDCEVPKNWSPLATNVVVSKYFYGEPNTPERERSVRQVIHRVARTIADWGIQDGYFATPEDGETYYRELTWLCLHQHAAFNSPVWFNVGLYHQYGVKGSVGNYHYDPRLRQVRRPDTPYEFPQASACFIQSVEDNMEGIMRLATSEAMLFKFGSGTGTDLSTIRSSKEKLSGGGTPSGPLSFMRVYDQIAAVVKSGGKTRRAAKMQSLKDWHPDIMEFIQCKMKEEKKARTLIASGEYDSNFNGEAYSSIMFQNANLSVRVSEEFMKAVEQDGDWTTRTVTEGKAGPTYQARHMLRQMAEGAWYCGDPGVQYETTINRWHTCKTTGPINASNPCCFVGSTLVDIAEGQISFEKLMELPTDKLPMTFAFDRKTRLPVMRQIKKVWVAGHTQHLVEVITDKGVRFTCTPEHRILRYDGEYVAAEELTPGTRLQEIHPYCVEGDPVASVERITLPEPVAVYDMEVEDTHNFSVTTADAIHSIVVSNSEYMFLDDTACNLSSINLKKCQREDGTFDVDRFRRACAIMITAQEILVDHASYPTPAIAENSHLFRPLGLGYANLGSLLMSMGIPYDSDTGRGIAGAITALLTGQGYATSAQIAASIGPFAGYKENEQDMLSVMQMHRDAVEKIHPACPRELRDAARQVWNEALQLGRRHGYRNAQATVLAPTGTIAFMMDCDTTGIEPDIALIKYKQLAGGGMMKIINRTVPKSLQTLGYSPEQVTGIIKYLEEHDTIEGAPGLKDEHLPVFDCAFKAAKGSRSIAWKAHVTMMAAAQPFLSGAISKTVNMPAESTVEDIELAYIEGWKLGLKALAIYRDGSKQSQPLNTSKSEKKGDSTTTTETPKPARRRLPDTRQSLTHKFNVGGHEGYITVGLFEDASPGELFITMAKEGSTIGGLMDVIGTETSLALQYGVPLEDLVNKFSHARFEPSGWTNNPDIPRAKSVVDYIFRWLGMQFIPGYREANAPHREGETVEIVGVTQVNRIAAVYSNGHAELSVARKNGRSEQFAGFQRDAPACNNCGELTVRNGNCYLCHNCGQGMGCS